MTLNQLETLTEDELALALYVVNVIEPLEAPKMEFEPRHLTWFRHQALVEKLVRAFPKLLPEGHPTFVSLMEKLGVKGEVRKPEPPPTPEPISSSLFPETPMTHSVNQPTHSLCPPQQNEKPCSTEPSTNTVTELPSI
jgi:hypothetical protein